MIRKHYLHLSSLLILINLFFYLRTNAQSIGINTTTALPDPSAMLDITSTDKGLLIPRVSLNDTIDTVTIVHPAISLLVYNTNNSMTGGSKGFWHWNGTKWQQTALPGGATGAVPYYNGSKWVTNSTNLYNNGGNIGIGTSTPNGKIHVYSGSSGNTPHASYDDLVIESNTHSGISFLTSGTSVSAIQFGDSNKNVMGTVGYDHSTDYLYFRANNAEHMRIDSNGYMGIGTTSPQAKLQVEGNIKLHNSAIAYRFFNVADYSSGASAPTGTLKIKLPVDGSYRMVTLKINGWQYQYNWTATVSGYARANTNSWQQFSPTVVTGNAPFNQNEIRLVCDTTDHSFYVLLGTPTTVWGSYTTITLDVDSRYANTVTAKGWNISIGSDPSIYSYSTPYYSLFGNNTYIPQTLNVGGTNQFQVNSSGNIVKLNNVTTSFPSSNTSGVLTNNGSGTLSWSPLSNNAWSLTGNSGTTAGTNFIGTTDAVDWVVKTNNTERMRVLSGGNVGIGTASPNGTLSIISNNATGTTTSSSLNLTANSLTSGWGLGISSNSITSGFLAELDINGTAALTNQRALHIALAGANSASSVTSYGAVITNAHSGTASTNVGLYINTINGTNNYAMVVPNGSVGIGTTTPASTLDVEGGVSIGASYSGTTAAPTNGAIIQGNVGIGTSSPSAKLDVRTNSAYRGVIEATSSLSAGAMFAAFRAMPSDGTTSDKAGLYLGSLTSDNAIISSNTIYRNSGFWQSSSTTGSIISMSAGSINFLTNSSLTANTDYAPTSRLYISASGNVGIGTTTPASKLDVEGGISIGSSYSGTTAAPTNGAIIEGNVGIGTSSPSSLLSVGSSSQFQVNSSGNIVKLNNVTTSFPSSNGTGTGVLKNDGSGNLSWSNNGAANIYEVHYSMGPSTISSLYTSPLTLVSAPGSSYYIEVISASISWSYNTTYTSNTTIGLYCHNATIPQASCALALPSTADGIYKFSNVSSGSSSDTQIIQNAALELKALAGNPSGGAGSADVYVLYRLVYN